jgi:hypothetical protein
VNTLPKSPESRPQKRHRWQKWLVITPVLGASILALVSWLHREFTRISGERELAIAVKATEASDPDWTWDRVTATRLQPETGKNGAQLIPHIKKQMHPEWGKELAKADWQPKVEVAPNVRYSPGVVAQVRRDLTDSAEAVKLAH